MPAHKRKSERRKTFLKKVLIWPLIFSCLTPSFLFEAFLGNRLSVVSEVEAANKTFTLKVDWKNGEAIGLDTDSGSSSVKLLAPGTWEHRNWRTPPYYIGTWGAGYATDGKYVYVVPGNGMNKLIRYSHLSDTWDELADIPKGVYMGGDLTYLNGNLYLLVGGGQDNFYRYDIAKDTWVELTKFPELLSNYTTAMTTDGTNIYAVRGATRELYLYNVANNSWIGKPQIADNLSNGDMIYYNGYLYYNNNSNPNRFYKYNLADGVSTRLTDFPANHYYDERMEIKDGYLYVLRGAVTTDFWRFNLTKETWETLAAAPATTQYGGAIINSPEGYLYIFRGQGSMDWWKYDVTTNTFLGAADAPVSVGNNSSDLVRIGTKYYTARAGNTTNMYEYDSSTGVWTEKASAPDLIDGTNRSVTDGRYVYMFQGKSTSNFYRFDTQTNTWTTLAATLSTVANGGTLIYPGTGDFIYSVRGSWTRTFWRYSISGNSWSDVAVTDLPSSVSIDIGSAATTDGSNIFVQDGLGTSRFFKYNIAGNSWTELAALPYAPSYGSDIAYDGTGKIYALAGNWDVDFYVYTIATDSWSRLPNVTPQYGYNRGVGNGASLEWDGVNSFMMLRGASQYVMKFKPGSGNYISSGTWESDVQDFKYVSSWNSINITKTTPGNSSVTVETSTSADRTTWSSWQSVSGTSISSPANRYLKIRATLNASSDRSQSPVLDEISIDYTGDEIAPSNPGSIVAKSQTVGGTVLTSGSTYSYASPYFSWPAAVDGQSNVAGYYVYFGNNNSANPAIDGSWQTNTNYLVTSPLTSGSYYLKIKTKDEFGNVANTWDAFTYVYSGIASEQSVVVSTSAEFDKGTVSDLQTGNDELRLKAGTSGVWLEDSISTAPFNIYYGGRTMAYVASTNKLYVMRGNTSQEFYEYDITEDKWTALANTPAAVQIGGGIIEGPDGYLYAMQGNNYPTFWKYSITENVWSDDEAMDMPNATYYGSSMVFDGQRYVYVMRGNNDDAFWKYDTFSNVWSAQAPVSFGSVETSTNNMVYSGGDLTFDGQNTIYAIQGNMRSKFAAYDMTANTWSSLPDTPILQNGDSSIAYDQATNAIYMTAGNGLTWMYKYDLATSTWMRVSDAPGSLGNGSDARVIGKYMYVTRGQNTPQMYIYRMADDSWMVPTRGIFGTLFGGSTADPVGNRGTVIRGSGTELYMVRGNYANDFVKYNYASGEITKLANLPTGSYHATMMVYVPQQDRVYYTSYGWQKIFVYNPTTDSWSEDETPPTSSGGYGAMVYDGARYIYWIRGGGSSFYRYDTQGSTGNKWSTMGSLPASVDSGIDAIYKDGYIYATRGAGTLSFYRYTVATNTWSDSDVADLPTGYRAYHGAALADGNDGYLYCLRGDSSNDYFKYSIANDTWEKLPNAPALETYGGSLVGNGSNRIFGFFTGSYSFNDGLYNYYQKTNDTSFVNDGSYISEAFDLGEVYRYSNLRVTYTSANDTTLTVKTRTSDDGVSWGTWQNVNQQKIVGSTYEYKINSAVKRYIQVKFEMASINGVYSGKISDYTINYVNDKVAPVNPKLEGFSASTGSASLVSGNWYPYTAPQFSWAAAEQTNGATDTATGSGVIGYNIYFGASESANPVSAGSFQTGNIFAPTGLVSGRIYNLRIKAKDDAGNVATDVWQPFVYKFDNVAPTQPVNLSADPSGYSAVNKFAFSWSEATDSASGVAGYCYKTGAAEGEYATERCTTELSLVDVPSYKKGVNTFYLRTKDNAGNFSAYSTVSFYFNDDSPSPPRSLTVSPATSDTNSFSFTWSAPEVFYGNSSNLRYFYSINALPSVANAQETPLNKLNAGAYATLPGENTFYIVAKDEAGNIDFKQYATVSFFANTAAPGMPNNMDIADVSVKATKSWKIAVTWQEPSEGGENVASYQVWRSSDGGSTYTKIASTAGISYVDTGLTQQTYYYKVKACDSANNCGAFGTEVHQYPDGKFIVPAELVDEPEASNMTTKKATITWTTNRTSDSKIAYGVESGKYIDSEVANSDQVMNHKLAITNLAPGTTYYYVTKWTDEDGNLGMSKEKTFATVAAPSAKEVKVMNIGLDKATISFTSSGASSVKVVYGKSTAFGGQTELAISPNEATYGVYLEGLEDGTKYYYRVDLYDVDGAVYPGDIYSFETLPRPKISNIKLQQVKGTATSTLLVTWNSNTEISSIATYYPSSSPSMVRDDVDIKMTKTHSRMIKGLIPNTSYTLIVKGRDKGGNEAVSEPQTFTTASDTRPPEISNLNTEMTIQGVGDGATAQLIVSWETDELSSSQVTFGEGSTGALTNKTQTDSLPVYTHLVVIQNLVPSKVYRLRAVSADQQNNIAESADTVIITPKSTESALNLVVGNLSQAFGFLGGFVGKQ